MIDIIRILSISLFGLMIPVEGFSQPNPGDVFREYYWHDVSGDAGQSLRVGGQYDYGGQDIKLNHDFDLEDAVRAEVIIEKILCHDSTRGLSIQVNGRDWIAIPEADSIAYPQYAYQHHFYPVVEIPLEMLNFGEDNVFKMKVSPIHAWSWPQNLINGVHFSIYYDALKKPHPTGEILSPLLGDSLGNTVIFTAEGHNPEGGISKIDYIGLYDDVNLEGDGIYYQWHYHYYHGELTGHIGSSLSEPYAVEWDTSWIPDQAQPMQVAARISDETGLMYMTQAVTGLDLVRNDFSVELSRPYRIPQAWVTRKSVKREYFDINGDIGNVVAAELVWSSWSPGYMNGIYINNVKVFDREGPLYQSYTHRVSIDSLGVFQQGENILSTGLTPLVNGEMVHGMEVNWPGIMVLIKYEDQTSSSIDVNSGKDAYPSPFEAFSIYPNPFNESTTLQYTLLESARVSCTIASITGQVVRTIDDSFHEPGTWTYTWDGRNDQGTAVGSGVFISVLHAGGYRMTRKMIHLR